MLQVSGRHTDHLFGERVAGIIKHTIMVIRLRRSQELQSPLKHGIIIAKDHI
jgi:hypothetical protein